ncbi:MAG: CoA transferase [Alphaproteobacteria bacterium]|nr:CoA transferase [Alphaproteobacteria bacterium]
MTRKAPDRVAETSLPLSGIRVLEIGHFIAGPFCSRLLADFGADVIKIEPVDKGDPVRTWGKQVDGRSPWWSVHGRNKRCVTLNLKHDEGRTIAIKLIESCDALVENLAPGKLAALGLDDKTLKAINPALIITHISGYGQTGPSKDKPAWGVIGEAVGGLRHLCAYPSDQLPNGLDLPPVRTGISIGDSIAGLYAAIGLLMALLARHRGSPTAPVDVALNEAVFSLMEGALPEYSVLGTVRQPAGTALPTTQPSNLFKSRDGKWIVIAANADRLFARLMTVIGRPDLVGDLRFQDNAGRCAHVDVLNILISEWAAARDAETAQRELDAAGVPATLVYDISDCAKDHQLRARDMIETVEDPFFGSIQHPGAVPRFGAPTQVRWAGPAIGEHNQSVYGDLLGMNDAELERLKAEGVI